MDRAHAMHLSYLDALVVRGHHPQKRQHRHISAMRPIFSARGSEDQGAGPQGKAGSQPPASAGTAAMRDAEHRPLRRLPGGVGLLAAAFTGTSAAAGIGISMVGRGRWMDNVFTQPRWRSLKHENIDLHDYATMPTGARRRRGSANGSSFTAHRPPREGAATDASACCGSGPDPLALPNAANS